ncbi:MAG: UDP-glucuronic acid decarboxylase family protein [Devosia sp.]
MRSSLSGASVAVTGGAGFIGGHLVAALLAAGARVTVIDNLSSGSMDAVRPFIGNSAYRFVEHDITTPIEVAADAIFNLACPASPVHYQKDPIGTWRASVIGTANLAELAARSGARFLQASTSEVYGDPLVHPQVESYWGNVNPNGLRACYDEGKRAAEALLADMARLGLAEIRVARIFNTYGPGMELDDGRAASNFVLQALRGVPLTVFGDGSQTRSLCYVADTVQGLIALMQSDAGAEPVNIGNPSEITMKALAEAIIELTGSQSELSFLSLPPDDPHIRRPDIARARQRLGWQPTIGLEDGLGRMIADFRARMG